MKGLLEYLLHSVQRRMLRLVTNILHGRELPSRLIYGELSASDYTIFGLSLIQVHTAGTRQLTLPYLHHRTYLTFRSTTYSA